MDSEHAAQLSTGDQCIAGRYQVLAELGRGGMAVVYRVRDGGSGREMALKQLVLPLEPKHQREAAVLFEREFHTLAQLSHPRVIEVYDYGVADGRSYYTMELLDGRDLRELSPLPWRQACSMLFDVCSSLALLHSRRLIHRDVSPRNIRCTHAGPAKLIDFGALVPMGTGGRVVGTPAFVAPEVVHRLATDARTDLFSLGATLYYALTGRAAYAARDFSELAEAWSAKPPPVSTICSDIPPALDALVLSLISLEPALRPRTAFEVMQRLATIAGLPQVEPSSVSQAYLATPVMVGRSEALRTARARIASALQGQGGGVLITGGSGVGRSRMLDACALEAKMLGAIVLRAGAGADGGADFAAAQSLAEQVTELFPDENAPKLAQDELCRWLRQLARRRALVIAVDDVQRIDEPSAALLAMLAHQAEHWPLLLVLTSETGAVARRSAADDVLSEHCLPLPLSSLSADETLDLLKSVFGDVPNVDLVSARIYEVALGNPRECMQLAQYLVDKRVVVYAGGGWALPSSLDAAGLPSSAEQAFVERIASLGALARRLAETQALASHAGLSRADYAALAAAEPAQRVDDAISELITAQVLVSDGRLYSLARGGRSQVTASLTQAELEQCHHALAELYAQDPATAMASVYHLVLAGRRERALDRLMLLVDEAEQRGGVIVMPPASRLRLVPVFERALAAALAIGRRPRDLQRLRAWLTGFSVVADDAVYWDAAPAWLAQLERDSGLAHWRELADVEDRGARLKRALEQVTAQYAATPETDRVFPPDEAIRGLVYYVVVSIAIGARTLDARLIASLPPLLEPFVALSPMIEAMWLNAICTYEANCAAQQDRARLRAADLYARLTAMPAGELQSHNAIRHALAYCAGAIEAMLGLTSAMKWADILDHDPMQRVNAMHIRKIVRLQQGDPEGAERFRKQAEVLAAQASARQMFTNTLTLELSAYSLAHDVTGVRHVASEIDVLAARHAGWVPFRHIAEGHFQRLCGNPAAALAAYDRCIALNARTPDEPWGSVATWPKAVSGKIDTLIELGREREARAEGERALARAAELGLGAATHDIARAMALAEAKLGDYASAIARLDRVIAEQKELGVTGLILGASYEARARIAIWAGDHAAVEEYGRLTAHEYRHGRGSPLGALYERLMADARRAGVRVLPQLSEFESTMMLVTKFGARAPAAVNVTAAIHAAEGPSARAACALQLICAARGAACGHLFLLGEPGLSLAASHPSAPRDEITSDLREFAVAQLAHAFEAESATMFVTDSSAQPSSATALWTDPRGNIYEPLPITCAVDGAELCVGVALVRRGASGEAQAGAAEVVASVGALLVNAGDARGMSPDDLAAVLRASRSR